MAKDLVRTRRYVRKFMLMKANIQAVALKIQTLKSQSTMAQAMRGVTRAMATMNRQLNMPQIQKILQVNGARGASRAPPPPLTPSLVAGVREAVRDHGHERGDDERLHRRGDGGRRRRGGEVSARRRPPAGGGEGRRRAVTGLLLQRRGGVADPGRARPAARRPAVRAAAGDRLAVRAR